MLQAAVDEVGTCASKGFKNAFEVGRFGVPARNRESSIKQMQGKIDRFLKKNSSNVSISPSGNFDPQTRTGIAAFRPLMNNTSGDQIDAALDRLILGLR